MRKTSKFHLRLRNGHKVCLAILCDRFTSPITRATKYVQNVQERSHEIYKTVMLRVSPLENMETKSNIDKREISSISIIVCPWCSMMHRAHSAKFERIVHHLLFSFILIHNEDQNTRLHRNYSKTRTKSIPTTFLPQSNRARHTHDYLLSQSQRICCRESFLGFLLITKKGL